MPSKTKTPTAGSSDPKAPMPLAVHDPSTDAWYLTTDGALPPTKGATRYALVDYDGEQRRANTIALLGQAVTALDTVEAVLAQAELALNADDEAKRAAQLDEPTVQGILDALHSVRRDLAALKRKRD